MNEFRYYKKYYITGLIFILLSIIIMIRLFEVNQEKFIIDIKSDIDNIDLGNAKYIWELDLNAIKNQILYYKDIKKIDLRLLLPNKLYIQIHKRKPIAIWWDYKNFVLVDEDGIVINDNASDKDKKQYIFLVGIDAIKHFKQFIQALITSGYNGKVPSMRFVGKRRWDIMLNDGTLIKLPEKYPEVALRLLDKLLKSSNSPILKGGIVDMRLAPKKVFFKEINNVKKQ